MLTPPVPVRHGDEPRAVGVSVAAMKVFGFGSTATGEPIGLWVADVPTARRCVDATDVVSSFLPPRLFVDFTLPGPVKASEMTLAPWPLERVPERLPARGRPELRDAVVMPDRNRTAIRREADRARFVVVAKLATRRPVRAS